MKNRNILTLLFLALLIGACSLPKGPVPLSGDVPEADGWDTEIVLNGLSSPWAVVWLPGNSDTLLITEKTGQLRMAVNYELQSETVNGLPNMYISGQGGLLDVSLHPQFSENRLIYFTYATGTEDANRTTIGRGELHGFELRNFEEIFRVSDDKNDDQHFGSRIQWLQDGTFLVSIADGGNYIRFEGDWIREQAQKLDSHFGKVLRLTDDGEAPADNPFTETEGALPEIWSLGHRNIQGITMEPESGRIWANEHGSKAGDELNLLEAGNNYGWPEVTYSREYHYLRISDKTTMPGMIDPKVVWSPAQAPSGLQFYTGDLYANWKGNLFSGGLVGEQVRRIVLDGEEVIGEEMIPIGRRVRSVAQGKDGYIYLLTDHDNGELIRIRPETSGG